MSRTMTSIAVMLALTAGPANSIIIRHDRPDAKYRKCGTRFEESLVHMNLEAPGKPPDGEGTLIAARWVLTAAHVAAEVEPGHQLTIAGRDYEVEKVFLHQEWDDGASHDIALIKLKTPVMNAAPAKLYPHQDEVGRIVTVVGRGDSGTGRSGPARNDRRVRAATNKVDGANARLLWWRFDAPGDTTGNVTRLEGISGPGDSGGPAFIDREGDRYLAGVSSAQSTRATGGREGVYGVTEYYVRISSYGGWLTQIMEAGR